MNPSDTTSSKGVGERTCTRVEQAVWPIASRIDRKIAEPLGERANQTMDGLSPRLFKATIAGELAVGLIGLFVSALLFVVNLSGVFTTRVAAQTGMSAVTGVLCDTPIGLLIAAYLAYKSVVLTIKAISQGMDAAEAYGDPMTDSKSEAKQMAMGSGYYIAGAIAPVVIIGLLEQTSLNLATCLIDDLGITGGGGAAVALPPVPVAEQAIEMTLTLAFGLPV